MSAHRNPIEFRTLILDLGDVLFTWSAVTTTSIPPRLLKDILNSPTWFEYERGRISQADCYARVGGEFGVPPSDVDEAFRQARESLRPNEDLLALVRELKARYAGQLRVFALSNISLPDYEYVIKLPTDWSIFDKVFPSALLGERKPDLQAYEKVVQETGIDPSTTVFVDDKVENVDAARKLGIHGIVFDKQEGVFQALRKVFGDRVQAVQEKPREGN
ncbi:phosphatase yihX [Dichomitus squalens]|uniref:Phosphatase yihX n=1 Tax=Dichomitus squalens TaxID=114155 RepID=A0A4Q9Q388_9APHY|nr:phosphatase yihX [Dichomitus squalens LYAD-421 SS1]EJF65437.1 phosphatase yihX [Dichomitus squalens LYAD-421 SS1]TBU45800.1 phosphatase yihX [Dichomitus squalens]TBU61737.1 phosphatase yihX [Dichomitus squalens]